MFHDKELSVNSIIWAYEPKGKLIHKEFIAYNGIKYDDEYEGTGKVIAKYKVTEVYGDLITTDYINITDWHIKNGGTVKKGRRMMCPTLYSQDKGIVDRINNAKSLGYTNQRYAYKLEKIADVSMELSKFYVASKYEYYKNHILDYTKQCTLTRYNGLTQVILRSDKE